MARKILTFIRHNSLDGISENTAAERDLKRAAKLFKRGDPIPESLWIPANAMLAERARALAFNSQRSYNECAKEILHRFPHLRLGISPFMRDREFSAIAFIDAQERDNDDES